MQVCTIISATGTGSVTGRSLPFAWGWSTPAGSVAQATISFYDISAAAGQQIPAASFPSTWAYVTAGFEFTTDPGHASGWIEVLAGSQLRLTVYPVATVGLSGQYQHALWANPGNSTLAQVMLSGTLTVTPTPQP